MPSPAVKMDAEEAVPAFDPSIYAVQFIPVDKIRPSRHQTRKNFDEAGIKSLAEAIRLEGLLTPINLRPLEAGTYEMIAGERRLRACKLLGYAMIPALVTPVVSEGAASIKTAMENLQREELNPIEEAEAFNKPLQVDPDHWTQEKVARVFGKKTSYLSNSLSLLRLPEVVQEKLRRRHFSRSHGIEIARLPMPEDQLALAKMAVDKDLTAKEVRRLVDEALGKRSPIFFLLGDQTTSPPPVPSKKDGKEGEVGGERGEVERDPLSDVWSELANNLLVGQTAHWKVQHLGDYKWAFEADFSKPMRQYNKGGEALAGTGEGLSSVEKVDDGLFYGVSRDQTVSPRALLSWWFQAMAGALSEPASSSELFQFPGLEEERTIDPEVQETMEVDPAQAWRLAGSIMRKMTGGGDSGTEG